MRIDGQAGRLAAAGVDDAAGLVVAEVAVLDQAVGIFAATKSPRKQTPREASSNPRHVPAVVRRAVHARDGEQCTFVSEDGRRCTERGFLELDHVTPVAVGGQPTIDGARMLCKRHNGYEAERILGAEVVRAGRERQRTRARTRVNAPPMQPPAPPHPIAPPPASESFDADTLRALRAMDVTAADARDALARSAHAPAETLEQRIRAALIALRPTYASRCSEPHTHTWGWRVPRQSIVPARSLESEALSYPRRGRASP